MLFSVVGLNLPYSEELRHLFSPRQVFWLRSNCRLLPILPFCWAKTVDYYVWSA